MKEKYMITEKQLETVDKATKMINKLPGGKDIKVFRSLTGTVRLQDDRNEETQKHTRMFCICKGDSQKKIMEMMMKAYKEIRIACEGK